MKEKQVTYYSYLKLEELLSLQQELSSPKHEDELLFITIHQSHELWFKLVIHEIKRLMKALDEDLFFEAPKTLSRLVAILKNLINQIEILHTLSPDEFLGYRDLLAPASGFQSHQYKMVEFLLGIKDPGYMERYAEYPAIYSALNECLEARTVWEKLIALLSRHGFPHLGPLLNRDPKLNYQPHPAVLEAVKTVYQNRSQFTSFHFLFEALVELDLHLQLWRLCHMKNAERVIGYKTGTGGSSGIDYLRSNVSRKIFPELWEVRGIL